MLVAYKHGEKLPQLFLVGTHRLHMAALQLQHPQVVVGLSVVVVTGEGQAKTLVRQFVVTNALKNIKATFS